MNKTCTRCGETKPIDQFPLCRGKPRARCKVCHVEDARRWEVENSERYKARLKEWHRKNKPPRFMGPPLPEWVKRERRLAGAKRWREANRERHKEMNRAWLEKNKHVAMEVVRRRQATKKKATPAWANRFFMQEAYHLAKLREQMLSVPYDVDHMVPLTNPLVCGLHCEANLQVIPRTLNRQKSNSWWPDMWEAL